MQIKEFAEFTGVRVRTLHYYDEIGLLRPIIIHIHIFSNKKMEIRVTKKKTRLDKLNKLLPM